jgi:hypothetical protein
VTKGVVLSILRLSYPNEKGSDMHKVKSEFKAASPMLHRRWDGKFYTAKLKPRRKKSVKPAFGYAKPHGQEN